jgi:hypothetical protein
VVNQGWWGWVKNTGKKIASGVAGFIAALPNGFLALGKNARDVLFAPITPKKILTIFFVLSALYANTRINNDFFKQAGERFKINMRKSCRSVKDFFLNLLYIVAGAGSGVIAGFMAFEGLKWVLDKISFIKETVKNIFTAQLSFIYAATYFVIRYLGTNKLTDRIFKFNSINRQLNSTQLLRHLSEPYHPQLQARIDEKARLLLETKSALDQNDIQTLYLFAIEQIGAALLSDPSILTDVTKREQILDYAALCFDLTFAFAVGSFSYITFSDKLISGIGTLYSLIASLITHEMHTLQTNLAEDLLLSILGLASIALYSDAALTSRMMIWDALCALFRKPLKLGTFGFDLVTHAASSAAMFNAAETTTLFNLPRAARLTQSTFTAVGAAFVNCTYLLDKVTEQPNPRHPTLGQLERWARKPTRYPFSDEHHEQLAAIYAQYGHFFKQITRTDKKARYDGPVLTI